MKRPYNIKLQRLIDKKLKSIRDGDKEACIVVSILDILEEGLHFADLARELPEKPSDEQLMDFFIELNTGTFHIEYHVNELREVLRVLLKQDRFQ